MGVCNGDFLFKGYLDTVLAISNTYIWENYEVFPEETNPVL